MVAVMRGLCIDCRLHLAIKILTIFADAIWISRSGPITIRGNHQLALGIKEDALPENALAAKLPSSLVHH